MLEDFWFAKRDGKGTTVEFLQGGQNLGEIEDVEYFKKKFYESLDVPITRLDPTSLFTLGRASEISREELRFSKFISRLRKRFAFLFEDLLKTQLILKNIVKEEEWNEISHDISYNFLEDNFFSELKMAEIYQNRFATVQATGYDGVIVSKKWIRENILKMTEEEMQEEDDQIASEKAEDDAMGIGVGEDESGEPQMNEPSSMPLPKKPIEPKQAVEDYRMQEIENDKRLITILEQAFAEE